MADRVSAVIQIGGTIFRDQLADLTKAIKSDGASIDWEGTPFDPGDIPVTSPLSLMDCEVANGEFDAIEECCRDLGLSYARWCGGYVGSFPSVRVVYPGYGEPETFLTTEDDTLIFPMDRIRILGSIEAIEAEYRRANCDPPPLVVVDRYPDDDTDPETARG